MSAVFSRAEVSQDFSMPRWSAPASFLPVHSKTWKAFYMTLVMMNMATGVHGAGSLSDLPPACVSDFDEGQDYFPNKVVADDAEHFEVEYHQHYKVVRTKNLLIKETYVLTLCGTPVPDLSSDEAFEGAKYFEVPLKKVAVESTTAATFLELLGLRSAIAVMDTTYITSQCLLAHAPLTLESEWGGDAAVRAEQLASVDALLHYTQSPDPSTIAVTESADPSPLNRAEWIEFAATFFNKEAEALDLFAGIKSRYTKLSEAAAKLGTKPVVAWIEKDWTETFTISTTQYKQDYVEAAGGVYFKPSYTNFPDNATLYETLVAGEVDVVIDSTYFYEPVTNALTAETFGWPSATAEDAPAWVKNQQVWRHDKAVTGAADDWFESSVPQPDAVLMDMVVLIHGEAGRELLASTGYSPRWFRNIAADEPQVANTKTCSDTESPLLPLVGDDFLATPMATDFSGAVAANDHGLWLALLAMPALLSAI